MGKEFQPLNLTQIVTVKRERCFCPMVRGRTFEEEYKRHYKNVTGKKHCRSNHIDLGWKILCYIELKGKPPNLKTMIHLNFFPKWLKTKKYWRKNELKKIRRFQLEILMKLTT